MSTDDAVSREVTNISAFLEEGDGSKTPGRCHAMYLSSLILCQRYFVGKIRGEH